MKIVKDLMVSLEDYSHVAVGTSLEDVFKTLAQAMLVPGPDPFRPRDRGVLIQARDGRVLGKLSLWDLLNGVKPNFEPPIDPFGRVDDRLLWSHWLSPEAAERARSIRVEDLLREPSRDEIIDDQAPLDLAVHRMISGRQLSLLVVRGDAIIGILRLSDVFRAVNEMISASPKQPIRV